MGFLFFCSLLFILFYSVCFLFNNMGQSYRTVVFVFPFRGSYLQFFFSSHNIKMRLLFNICNHAMFSVWFVWCRWLVSNRHRWSEHFECFCCILFMRNIIPSTLQFSSSFILHESLFAFRCLPIFLLLLLLFSLLHSFSCSMTWYSATNNFNVVHLIDSYAFGWFEWCLWFTNSRLILCCYTTFVSPTVFFISLSTPLNVTMRAKKKHWAANITKIIRQKPSEISTYKWYAKISKQKCEFKTEKKWNVWGENLNNKIQNWWILQSW